MKNWYLLIAVVGCACSQPKEQTETVVEETMSTVKNEMAAEGDSTHFGRLINDVAAVSSNQLMNMMTGQDSLEIKIAATAVEVCQAKGCWMKVDIADGQSMRIKFKDYGFFVPKDLAGKPIVFSGKAFKETTSVEDLRHYAKDGGATEEAIAAITTPETSISFLADGVLIR